nr:hypothetical protein [Tanacetum cinerariifolium]
YVNTSQYPDDPNMPELEDITYSDEEEDVGAIPTTRVYKDHPVTQIFGDLSSTTQIRSMTRVPKDQDLCKAFGKLMKDKLQMSSIGELTFFLGLQMKSASTPIDTEKRLLKDHDGKDVDVHTFRSMIGSLVYLTSSRPNIMFAVALSGMESLKRMFLVANILSVGYLTTPQMVLNSPCLTHIKNWLVQIKRSLSWLVQKQTALVDEKVGIRASVVDLQVSAVRLNVTAVRSSFCRLTSVAMKKVNDVTRLQALVDKKRVIITKATIREDLRLDDAEGIDCLPNEEIFIELARMGYEKPSTKPTFYKAFFSCQWKFLIHTILQCKSAKRTSWNEFSSSMASAVICLSIGRKFNFSKYIFDSLVRNVDSSTKFYMYPRFLQLMIRAQLSEECGQFNQVLHVSTFPTTYDKSPSKGFFGVETPLFEGMILEQQVGEGVDEVHVDDVPAVGVVAEGAASVADDEVPAIDAQISIDLLQNLLDTCTTLTRRVEHLEQDKIAQALEITKLKQRVKKLERSNKASKLRRLQKVGTSQRIETSDDTVMDDVSKQRRITAVMDADKDVTLKDVAAVAKDVQDAKIKKMQMFRGGNATITAVAPQLTTAAALTLTTTPSAARRRKGVVIRDLEETATPSTIIHSDAKSKDKGKEILYSVDQKLPLRVENLEQDKIAQALEITKLKQRVKKLKRRNKLKMSKLRRLKRVETAQRVDTYDDTVMDDVSKQGRIITDMDADVDVTLNDIAKDVAVDAEIEESVDVQGRQA